MDKVFFFLISNTATCIKEWCSLDILRNKNPTLKNQPHKDFYSKKSDNFRMNIYFFPKWVKNIVLHSKLSVTIMASYNSLTISCSRPWLVVFNCLESYGAQLTRQWKTTDHRSGMLVSVLERSHYAEFHCRIRSILILVTTVVPVLRDHSLLRAHVVKSEVIIFPCYFTYNERPPVFERPPIVGPKGWSLKTGTTVQ